MPTSSRLAIWCLALLLSVTLYVKGRFPAPRGEEAAFLRARGESVTVRLAGGFPRAGVYRFPVGTSVRSAIKMTVADPEPLGALPAGGAALLQTGDVLNLSIPDGKNAVISITKMGAQERMLLQVPLDPDRMSAKEWALLPGIGPVLSKRIVAERHENGAFGSLDEVLRVPGIGPAKLEVIKKYF
ncbi:ComEA family DNA-binding protein [Citrifermentans bremense]|uniref:ComEA family DNA-binding protein n=1 Tax=Citrifermentans bremense TaxID=60035 RepID=UPI00047DF018|nr:helix-hairpin-helix domain-containing protein [Citrifermentans bremense]